MFDRMRPLITILDLHRPDVNSIEVLSRLRTSIARLCDHDEGIATEEGRQKLSH